MQPEQQQEHRYADHDTKRRMDWQEVIAAYPGDNTEGDTVKQDDMPEEQAYNGTDNANNEGVNFFVSLKLEVPFSWN